jgi:hypothetical protein
VSVVGIRRSFGRARSVRLTTSLLAGLALGFLTWVMIGNHSYSRPTGTEFNYLGEVIMIVLFPGTLAAIGASGNIHIVNTWMAMAGNFVFYFGVVYLVLANREKRKAKHRAVSRDGT